MSGSNVLLSLAATSRRSASAGWKLDSLAFTKSSMPFGGLGNALAGVGDRSEEVVEVLGTLGDLGDPGRPPD